MKLNEFLTQRFPKNAFVEYPGFDELYVRKGQYAGRKETIQIARIQATESGQGAFECLFKYLQTQSLPIVVECVHNKRFVEALLARGFVYIENHDGGAPTLIFEPETDDK